MPGEQRGRAPLPSALASGPASGPPSKNHAPAGRTPKASGEEAPEATPDPNGAIEPWALLLGPPPLSSPPQPCSLQVAGSMARPPLDGTPESLPCGGPKVHVRPEPPKAEAPPAPEDLSFQRGFPDTPEGFVSPNYCSPRPLPLRAPPSGGRSPCEPGSYSDLGALGAQAWPHTAGDSFPGTAFGVPPPEPKSFPYPFTAPHGPGPKPFSEGAAGQPCAQGVPLFASPHASGEWSEEVGSTDPTYPLPMPSGPAPPLCYPSQPGGLNTPQDLSRADPEAGAAPLAPSPFSGSRGSFLEGLHGESPNSLPQGQFPGPGSLDLPLVSPGHPPTGLPQLWGPATPSYPTGPPLGAPAAAGMVFLEDQPSPSPQLGLPWAPVLSPASSGTQQMGVLSPPSFPPATPEWPGSSQGVLGAGGPGGERGALGARPGSSPQLCSYNRLKDPGASALILGAGQPQVSPQGPPLPQDVAATPSESPLPSPAAPTAGSSCSSLSPPSDSPANPSSEDSQLPGSLGVPAYFQAATHPQEAGPQLLEHYQPIPARACAFSEDTGDAQGAFGCLRTVPFPGETPCSEQHFLDQLGVLLTCRQCDRNYSSVAAFLGHRPYCSPGPARPKDTAPPQLPGSPTPPATPKAPTDGVPGPFPVPGTGPALLAEGKDEALSAGLLPATPFPPPAALDLDLEDAAKLDSLITEALHGLECQAHSPEIDSSFIDVFTDEESPAGAAPREPQGPQPRAGSPPACSRPQTRSRGPVPAGGAGPSPASQQRRGKRFKLPVQDRGLAVATAQRPGRGPRLRPRRKNSLEQAPGSQAEPRKALRRRRRRRARGRMWSKIVQQKQRNQRTPGLRPQEPDSGSDDSEGPWSHLSCPRGPRGQKEEEVGSSPGTQAGRKEQRPRKEARPQGGELSGPCSVPTRRPEAGAEAQGPATPLPARDPAASPGHPWPGPPCMSAPGDPSQEPLHPEITDETSQDTPEPLRKTLNVSTDTAGSLVSSGGSPGAPLPCTMSLNSSGLGGAPALVNGVSSGTPQSCSKPSSNHSHQDLSLPHASVSPQAGQGLPDWSRGTCGTPNMASTDPGLGGSALAMGPDLPPGCPSSCFPRDRAPPGPPPSSSPPSQSPPSSPPDLSCDPPQAMSPHPGMPGQGQSEPQLDIRKLVTKLDGQLEASWGEPGTPGQPGRAECDGAPWVTPAPQSTFTEVSFSGPGSDAATVTVKVTPESSQGEWGVTVPLSAISKTGLPKAEVGQEAPPGDLQALTLEMGVTGASSEHPTADQAPGGRQGSGPALPCRQRVGRSPRPPRTHRRGLAPCSSPGALLAPDVTFGGVEALSQGTPLRASPQNGQEGFCPVPSPGRAPPPLPQLCAVGREDTSGSGGPPVAADTYRPLELPRSCVDGGWGRHSALTDVPGTGFATPDSAQLRPAVGLTQPHRAARPDEERVATRPARPVGSLKCPAQERPLTVPSGGSQDLPGLLHLPVSPQRAMCTPEPSPQISPHSPQQGPLLDRPPKNQDCRPRSDPADWTEAHLEDKTGTPTGPRKENPRGSPPSRVLSSRATTPIPERLETVRPDPHTSSGPASSDPPGHSAHIGPRAAQGSSTATSDTAVSTHDVLAPAATCPSAEHRPHTATPTPQDSGVGPHPGSFEDKAVHTCDICSAAFRSRPGLSRHRAWRHGLRRAAKLQLCTPTLPAPQPQDTPRKKSRTQPRKVKPRQALGGPRLGGGGKNSPEAPRPELGAGCAPSQELDSPRRGKPGGPEKGSGQARHRPSGRQAEAGTHPSGGRDAPSSPEPWAGERAVESAGQRPCGESRPCIPVTRTSDPSTSDPATPASEPGAHSSQPPGRTVAGPGGTEAGPAAERLQPRKGVTGPQTKKSGGRREMGTSGYNRHLSRLARGPPQPPLSSPESLQSSVPKLKKVSPDASSLGLEAPMSLPGADNSLSQLLPRGTLPSQKRKPAACGKQRRRNRTKPPPLPDPHSERAGASDTGTSGHQPTDLCGSSSLSLSDGSFLPDSCGPWGPRPSLWAPEPPSTAPHTQDLTENIPELHRIPAAWRSPLGEPLSSQDGGSPEPPSLEPEPYPSLLPTGSLDLQMLRVKLEVQDLCFLGSCEDSAELPRLSGLDLGTTAGPPRPPTPGSPSQARHSRAQMGARQHSVCFQHFPGLAELDVHTLSRNPAPPPTCYMCVERRFGSHQLLQEHLQEKHAQNEPGPWACSTCLREEADIWTYNAHLQDHALSSAHHGPVPGTPGWEDHNHVPHFLSSLMGTVLRPHGGQPDGTPCKALGPEPPGSESPRGWGSAQVGAPSISPPSTPAAPWVPPTVAMHVGCRDESRDCHHCGKSFPKPFKLQRHLPVHSALRIFLCPRCPRVYLEHSALRAHLGAEHGAGAEREVPPTALFSCELCADVACASKRAFVCSACNFTFAKKDQLRRHLDKHRRRARPPAPLRRGRRPGPPRQNIPGREGALPSKRCRVAMPGSPPVPSLPHPLSLGANSLMAIGDACPDPAPSCLAMATNPTEEPGEPRRVPPRGPLVPPESAAPSKGSCKPAGSPQSSRGEMPSSGPRPPAQQAVPLRPAPKGQGMEEKSGTEALPGTCRPPSAPNPCHEAPSKSQKPDPRRHPAPVAASEGPLIKPGGCRALSKDRLGGTTTSKAPQIPAQHKKVRRSPPPVGPGPQHSRGAGGSRPQPASGRLQSEAASTPTKADSPGQNPTLDRPPSRTPAEGCPRGSRNMGEQGGPSSRDTWRSSEERRKGQSPSVPDKPPRAPRKQATPCRVLPAKLRPGAQNGRTTRQASEQGTLIFGDPRQRGLAKAFPHAGPLHGRPKRGRVGQAAAAPAPRPCLTAESQNHLLSQLFGPRLSCFKIPLKKGPSA